MALVSVGAIVVGAFAVVCVWGISSSRMWHWLVQCFDEPQV